MSSVGVLTSNSSTLVSDIKHATPPVTYLRVHPTLGVIHRTEHRCCYTPENYSEHLKRAHGVEGLLKKRIDACVTSQNISREVTQPPHYGPPLPGLGILSGWECNCRKLYVLDSGRPGLFPTWQFPAKLEEQTTAARRCFFQGADAVVMRQVESLFYCGPDVDAPSDPLITSAFLKHHVAVSTVRSVISIDLKQHGASWRGCSLREHEEEGRSRCSGGWEMWLD